MEGPTDNPAVQALRQRQARLGGGAGGWGGSWGALGSQRTPAHCPCCLPLPPSTRPPAHPPCPTQMRNLHLALMLSQGTPMVLIGDEYGQTRKVGGLRGGGAGRLAILGRHWHHPIPSQHLISACTHTTGQQQLLRPRHRPNALRLGRAGGSQGGRLVQVGPCGRRLLCAASGPPPAGCPLPCLLRCFLPPPRLGRSSCALPYPQVLQRADQVQAGAPAAGTRRVPDQPGAPWCCCLVPECCCRRPAPLHVSVVEARQMQSPLPG